MCTSSIAAARASMHEQPGDVDNWRTWIDDVAVYLDNSLSTDATRSQPRRLPTVLCGISWGGKLAPAVARRHAALVDALALICPGIYSPFLPGLVKRDGARRARARRLAAATRANSAASAGAIHRYAAWQEFIAQDPLALRSVTWRFAQEDRHLTRFARQVGDRFFILPVLMMLAGQDRIVDNDRTRQFFGRVAGQHKTLIEYGGAAHTLEFEPDPSTYFADLADWLARTAMRSAVERFGLATDAESELDLAFRLRERDDHPRQMARDRTRHVEAHACQGRSARRRAIETS